LLKVQGNLHVILVIITDGLEKWFWSPVRLQRPDFFPFNRSQSGVVIGLLTGHNTLRRHLHLMGLTNGPLCRGCGAEKETSAHILCECEALASLGHTYTFSWAQTILTV